MWANIKSRFWSFFKKCWQTHDSSDSQAAIPAPQKPKDIFCEKSFCTELKVSLVLASATFIMTQLGWLNFTDHLTLSMTNVGSSRAKAPPDDNHEKLKVVLLTDLSYESDFNQSSPLNRKKLTKMFVNILERKPKVIAVDLDLAPRPPKSEGQDDLDNLLKDIEGKYKETKIVLITPMPVVSNKMAKVKADWIKEMCQACVTFAYPDIYSHLGVVTKYSESASTLGGEAYRLSIMCKAYDKGADKPDCSLFGGPVCERLTSPLKSEDDDRFLRKNEENRYTEFKKKGGMFNLNDKLKLSPINAESYQNMKVIQIFNLEIAKAATWDQIKKDDVVFVGGSYGFGDEYDTPSQNKTAGVIVHAATFYTKGDPVEDIWLWAGYLIDVIIGIISGLIFMLIDCIYGNCKGQSRVWRAVINLFVMLVLMFFLLCVARYLLEWGLWIQPGPMLVGMYLTVEILDCKLGNTFGDKVVGYMGWVVVIAGVGLLMYKSFT